MVITPEQQEKAFAQANDIQKNLYSTPQSGIKLHKICAQHKIIDKKMPFFVAVGDVILGLVPQEKLPELLVERLNIDQAKARQITADVLDFLAPLEEQQTTPATTSVPINTLAPQDNSLTNEIAEAEALMNNMQPIRTMSHDMEVIRSAHDEPTHTAASQEDLLDRTATPKDKNYDARWDTEQN